VSMATSVSESSGLKPSLVLRFFTKLLNQLKYPIIGLTGLIALWWLGGYLIQTDPDMSAFSGLGPAPAFLALQELVVSEDLWSAIGWSLYRILVGLFWSIVIGVPVGILIGYVDTAMKITNVPFQFVRMISPLAWMPIAVLAYDTWDAAIIFLIVMAAVWPIIFSTANGVKKIDPNWFKVAGIRLAVGVAWVVLVPAEYLGVTSGLGYAINDARDTLSYDNLAAVVVVIGVIGYGLDSICGTLVKRFNWKME
jgi:NitT/TauT family transport system permease protein